MLPARRFQSALHRGAPYSTTPGGHQARSHGNLGHHHGVSNGQLPTASAAAERSGPPAAPQSFPHRPAGNSWSTIQKVFRSALQAPAMTTAAGGYPQRSNYGFPPRSIPPHSVPSGRRPDYDRHPPQLRPVRYEISLGAKTC